MQACIATARRHDRADYWRRRLRLYTGLLWLACFAGGFLLLGVLARQYAVGGYFIGSGWGHLLAVILPLVVLLMAASVAVIAANDEPARPIRPRPSKLHIPPVPAASWPASAFERPPRRTLVA